MPSDRIKKELGDLRADHSTSFTVEPTGEDVFNCKARIMGPPHSPYAGGVFILNIHFPPDYPFKPPKIYHPNINSRTGDISVEILSRLELKPWDTSITISKVLHSICSALEEPEERHTLEFEIDYLYRCKRPLYEQTAREWTIKYAME